MTRLFKIKKLTYQQKVLCWSVGTTSTLVLFYLVFGDKGIGYAIIAIGVVMAILLSEATARVIEFLVSKRDRDKT